MVISLGNQYEIEMRKRLRKASKQDLYRAAEAVVDAAICFQEANSEDSDSPVPAAEFRHELIQAVLHQPGVTLDLLRSATVH